MIYLGSVIFFRWEKYRFVLVLISFLTFHFCTIIAVCYTFCSLAHIQYMDNLTKKAEPFLSLPLMCSANV